MHPIEFCCEDRAETGRYEAALRLEIRRAIKAGQFAGLEVPRSIPDVIREVRAAEAELARTERLAGILTERVCGPLDARNPAIARAIFGSPGYAALVSACEAANDAVDTARVKLARAVSDGRSMLCLGRPSADE